MSCNIIPIKYRRISYQSRDSAYCKKENRYNPFFGIKALAGAGWPGTDRGNHRSGTDDRPRIGNLSQERLQPRVDQPAPASNSGAQGIDRRMGHTRRSKRRGIRDSDRRDHESVVWHEHAAVQKSQGFEERKPARQHDDAGVGS